MKNLTSPAEFWDSLDTAEQSRFVRLAWDAAEFQKQGTTPEYQDVPYRELCAEALSLCGVTAEGMRADDVIRGLQPLKTIRGHVGSEFDLLSDPVRKADALVLVSQTIAARLLTKEDAEILFDVPSSADALQKVTEGLETLQHQGTSPSVNTAATALLETLKEVQLLTKRGHGISSSAWMHVDRRVIAKNLLVLEDASRRTGLSAPTREAMQPCLDHLESLLGLGEEVEKLKLERERGRL